MIKLFRHIRRTLLEENKMGKYFKYAVGEIVLVVIGILIALQINNWNDYRKSVANSKVYLRDLVKDLSTDTLYLNRAIPTIERELNMQEWLLNKTRFTQEDIKTYKDSTAAGYWDFYINSRTFEKIQNSEQSKLVGFDSLFGKITRYYSAIKIRMEKTTEYEIRESTKSTPLEKQYFKTIEINTTFQRTINGKEVEKSFPLSVDRKKQDKLELELLNSIESRNQLKLDYGRRIFILKDFKICKQEADKLLKEIDKALFND